MLDITIFCPFMLPAMVVAYWLQRDGRRLKFKVLVMYIAVRGFLCCSSFVQPAGYCIRPLFKYGSCSSAIVG